MIKTSLFITFEGIDKLGKTTQIKEVEKMLKNTGYEVLSIYDPGYTEVGEKIRLILKNSSYNIAYSTELLLFHAARAQLYHEVIKPSLEKGKIVLCDRFLDSTRAYQGYGEGWSLELLSFLHKIISITPEESHKIAQCNEIYPDLTFIFQGEQFNRQSKTDVNDRFDNEKKSFIERVKHGYYDIFSSNKRCILINANDKREHITNKIFKTIINNINRG